jgi:UDP-hydrolysing UDP-N-acetyl-D-glucosamine 2-epimerase
VKKNIFFVVTSRADYSICDPILEEINKDNSINAFLIVSGMLLKKKYGYFYKFIKKYKNIKIIKVNFLLDSDTPKSISLSVSLGIKKFTEIFTRYKIDLLFLFADKYEMFAASIAALPLNIKVAHVEGGEITSGVIDDQIRHCITKLSHLHFVSNPLHKKVVKQLGEDPKNIHVTGSPSLNNIKKLKFTSKEDLEKKYKLIFKKNSVLVTYHPVTINYLKNIEEINNILKFLQINNLPAIFTMPNADTGNTYIKKKILNFVKKNKKSFVVENFGSQDYLSVLNYVNFMLGNSSSGLIEASSFKLPVINIGDRQRGRISTDNVIHSSSNIYKLQKSYNKIINKNFIKKLKRVKNPYFKNNSVKNILKISKKNISNYKFKFKEFYFI